MKMVICALVLALALSVAAEALADCVYAGESYPTGTRVGNSTCQADGSWR